jgi:MFS family permease
VINGSFWIGALLGSSATLVLLDPYVFDVDLGWRLGFGVGAMLGLLVFLARRHIPESPRWLAIHGYAAHAESVTSDIERRVSDGATDRLPTPGGTMVLHPRIRTTLGEIIDTMMTKYRGRSALCFMLITSQAFLYNAIFFTYALVLREFYAVPASETGWYLMPFAIANFLGPLVLGHAFDSIGRRPMIVATYTVSSLLLVATGACFAQGWLTAYGQTALWAVIFFFASAAASSAYLTASEIFPLELRAMAIAVFFALGTGAGGVLAPWLFGLLIGTGSRTSVFWGYALGAALMLAAAAAALKWGVRAERTSLETIAPPLSAVGK